jgi:hypothetical protein
MANSNKDVFAIKTVQSLLREVSLYGGRIDGLFGKGAQSGFVTMLKSYNKDFNTPLSQGSYLAYEVFTYLQTGLAAVGLYTGTIDGKWGKNTAAGLEALVASYRTKQGIPELWYAWSGNKNVPVEGIRKYEAWMQKWDKALVHVSYILSCNALETGRTFNPSIRNPKSGAVGLIQFMPKSTAPDLGTTADALAAMSFVDQLDYVFKYFEKYGYIKKCNYLEDYYLSIFYPANVGKDPNEVVGRAGSALYSQNSGFDADKKGYYTVGDIASAINQFYWDGLDPKNRIAKP